MKCIRSLKSIAFSVLLSIFMICSVDAAESGADETVYRLYRDFGWTALFEDDGNARHYFGGSVVDQPAPVLSKYFSHDLVVLLRKEHECGVKQKGSLCKLGFDPLFASQDSAATKLLIESSSADMGLVRVNFIYPPNGEKINIKFLLKKYKNGWKIDDVIYGNMHDAALKSILGAR